MTEPVKLYVYDLSNGMARQISQQLTGRQIDGIWHTSIVIFGREIFFGQGICIAEPGKSHHGQPLQIIDLGETAIDQDTFNEYLDEMREQYTADRYHLLDFNCNSFTNDCSNFLTGNPIPAFIKDLPTDFLATPFGQALRPTIDAMYRPPPGGAPSPAAQAPAVSPDLAASILQAVAAQAQQQPSASRPATASAATQSLTGSIQACSNMSTFHNLIGSHKAVVAYFSNQVTCPPCRMISPIFEQLASDKGLRMDSGGHSSGAVFTKIDMATPSGNRLAGELRVRVMPTFMFFLNGQKVHELQGADPQELRTQIDLLLFQAYPPHPHTSLSLPAIQALSTNPILFTQCPNLDVVSSKLSGFIDTATWPAGASQSQLHAKQVIGTVVIPYLKARFSSPPSPSPPSATPAILKAWSEVTAVLCESLPLESLFPAVDLWRLGVLDPAVATWAAGNSLNPEDPLSLFLNKAAASFNTAPRPFLLTLLRLLSNSFSHSVLANRILAVAGRTAMTSVLIPSLLHSDAPVRTAAAGLAFNAAGVIQKSRISKVRSGGNGQFVDHEDEDWEVEVVSAVIEALDREKENEEFVHRTVASLAFLLRLSPFYDAQLGPMLEVLQARKILKEKLENGGCGAKGVEKKEVRKLVEEVAGKLCP